MNDLYEIIPYIPPQIERNRTTIKTLDNNNKFIETKNENVRKMVEDNEKRIQNIEDKMKDMNILGMFKGLGGEDGVSDNFIKMMNNLDNKLSTKINLIEEKMKKIEETNFKTNKDVQKVLNTFDLNKRNFEHLKENIESLDNKFNTFELNTNTKLAEITNIYSSEIEFIKKNLETLNNKKDNILKLDSKGDIILKDKNEENKIKKINSEFKEKYDELKEHLTELDKFIKSFVQKAGIEQMKTDISSLKTSLWNCSTLDDIKEAKEREDELQKKISVMKEQIDDIIAKQIDHDDFMSFKRKVESLLNITDELESNFDEILNKKNFVLEKNRKKVDTNKFLEIKKFEEFKTQMIKEFTNINDNFNLLRGLTDRLGDSMNNKASFNDLKTLEEDLEAKLEDLSLTFNKKFSERTETNKNFKFLDQQIKNLFQFYIKKNEKDSNNWLIAKKPLNSNLCASCDAYIGDLKENSNYVPWNKYPNREGEKLYRLGNGFSKMLQMINVDENDKKIINDENMMYTEINKEDGGKTIDKGLPKIKNGFNQTKSYFHTNTNINNLNFDEGDKNKKSKKDKDEPKITKIYRMNKDKDKENA